MYRRNDWLCAGAPGCAVQVLLLFMIRVAAGALAAGTLPASPLPAQGRERPAQGLITNSSSAEVVCMSRRQCIQPACYPRLGGLPTPYLQADPLHQGIRRQALQAEVQRCSICESTVGVGEGAGGAASPAEGCSAHSVVGTVGMVGMEWAGFGERSLSGQT